MFSFNKLCLKITHGEQENLTSTPRINLCIDFQNVLITTSLTGNTNPK